MKKYKMDVLLLAIILTGTSLFAIPKAYAQTPGTNPRSNFFQELISYISQKLGVDQSKVQSAVTDFKQQRKANVTPRPTLTPQQTADKEKSRLDKLVTDKKITAEQETKIINELTTLRTKYNPESLKNLTPDQRKTQIQAMREEIISWAKSQGIDSSYVIPGFGFGGRGQGMGGKGWGKGK